MSKIKNWERWKQKENMNSNVKKAWTHSILRDLYRGAEDEWNVQIIDNREVEEEYEVFEDRWKATIFSSTIDSPGSFKDVGFDTLEEAEDFALKWMRDNPLESELGWMNLAGSDDKEHLEERVEHFEDRGVEARVRKRENLYELQVDTEDFIEQGFRLG